MVVLVACLAIMARDEANVITDSKADSGPSVSSWHKLVKHDGNLTVLLFTKLLNVVLQLGEQLIVNLLLLKIRDSSERITSLLSHISKPLSSSLNFLLAPFTFYQQFVQAGRTAMDRELPMAQKAA